MLLNSQLPKPVRYCPVLKSPSQRICPSFPAIHCPVVHFSAQRTLAPSINQLRQTVELTYELQLAICIQLPVWDDSWRHQTSWWTPKLHRLRRISDAPVSPKFTQHNNRWRKTHLDRHWTIYIQRAANGRRGHIAYKTARICITFYT